MPTDVKLSEFPKPPIAAVLDSSKKIATEIRRFSPSSIVSLYEIDIEGLLIDKAAPYNTTSRIDAVFRFHNNLKLLKQDIIWRGQTYRALPIKIEGYESSTRGATATPRMSLLSNDASSLFFTDFRAQLRKLDDLVGAKVTRIRTFTKYLDEANFFTTLANVKTPIGNIESIVPEDFEPDPLAEFPREIFFIERKSAENKSGIEFELSSAIDFENLKLPKRAVLASFCNFTYRGEGCLYEYNARFDPVSDAGNQRAAEQAFGSDDIRGGNVVLSLDGGINLPNFAPPIANVDDELFKDLLGDSWRGNDQLRPARWNSSLDYTKGDAVFLKKDGIRRYFTAKSSVTNAVAQPGSGPPNTIYWLADQCSKTIKGCKIRWSNSFKISLGLRPPTPSPGFFGFTVDPNSVFRTHRGALPFGGFPAANKIQ